MSEILHQRCWNHANREAVARCMTCGRFFCRECAGDHEGRTVCASCLRTAIGPRSRRGSRILTGTLRTVGLVFSVFLLWASFYILGNALLLLPNDFHEGTFLRAEPWE